MKRMLIVISCLLTLALSSSKATAATVTCETDSGIFATGLGNYTYDPTRTNIVISVSGSLDPSLSYRLFNTTATPVNGVIEFNVSYVNNAWMRREDYSDKNIALYKTVSGKDQKVCEFKNGLFIKPGENGCNITFWQNGKKNLACYNDDSPISVSASDIFFKGAIPDSINVKEKGGGNIIRAIKLTSNSFGPLVAKTFEPKVYPIVIEHTAFLGQNLCEKSLTVRMVCDPKDQEEGSGSSDEVVPYQICNGIEAGDQKTACQNCANANGVWTALGCIKTDPKAFIADFLKISLGVAGGIALLLMVYGAFLVSVSAGDPKKAEEGKEIITGTIAGLLFIIFSVFLLKLIGVDILKIPGF